MRQNNIKKMSVHINTFSYPDSCELCCCVTHSGEESGVRLDMSSWVGTVEMKVKGHTVK